ncbi:hypothetical protein AK812_SmicGene25362 [Symbiodinium microadriaticum]|uniref:Uncharacterized protein n=1 Tax=Symbiodinium microadriaticum TaxID=2951 RepID=A0A1Q9DC12_SYMMI|nr:hypothetical protein AK812_SmicGene25362 [Symbiodinium microadriaticum]CAE7246966.1 unnamed protein product [Symbiodinium microadriaticum]
MHMQLAASEEAAILQALWRLLPLGTYLQPAVSLATRNELMYLAQTSLTTDAFEQMLQLLDKLEVEATGSTIIGYPGPSYVNACESTPAEKTADRHLREGSRSLWVAVRETVRELEYQPDARPFAQGRYAKFGLYSKGGLVGMAKQTSQHVSTCRLLNAATLSVRPEHRWTSITIGMDNETLPHVDQGNATFLSLLLGLTHHVHGELWLESVDGSQYMALGESRKSLHTPFLRPTNVMAWHNRWQSRHLRPENQNLEESYHRQRNRPLRRLISCLRRFLRPQLRLCHVGTGDAAEVAMQQE